MTLDLIFYLVIGLSIVGYAILDGFDLGVGMLHLFAKTDEERRVSLNAIGPVWDGNEVWLVIVGGALFAGFPDVYATFFSTFYNLTMVLLVGLIFRAVAIEFRSKRKSQTWRFGWDTVFCVASYIIAFGIGIAMGNLIEGVPLNEHKDFVGTHRDFLRPYTVLVGILGIAVFMLHGAVYMVMKTEGELHDRLRKHVTPCIIFFVAAYLSVTSLTLVYMPHMTAQMKKYPWLFVIGLLAILAVLNVHRLIKKGKDGSAFLFSCLGITLFICLFGIGTFPNMIRSSVDPEHFSLTIFNSSSSPLTLKVLLWIVGLGIPLVLGYGYYIYRVFRGKVKLDSTSY